MKKTITYNYKIIEAGDEIEVYSYRFKQSKKDDDESDILIDCETDKQDEKNESEIKSETEADESYKRKKENIRKTKIKLRRLINANAFQYEERDKFITLTFAGDPPTRDEVVQKFYNFGVRLRRKFTDVKYIAVIERGSKGTERLHLHCLFFNLPYVDKSEFQKMWKYGYVDIQAIDSFYDLAQYILKYIEKTLEDGSYIPKGKRFYFPSRGLKKPIEHHLIDEAAQDYIEKICDDKEVVCEFDFKSDYCGECHYVKYKKIRDIKPKMENIEDLLFYLNG